MPISSLYLEMRAVKYAKGEPSIVCPFDIKRFLKWLLDNELPGMQDPLGIGGCIHACQSEPK